MKNAEIQVFENENFGSLRTADMDGSAWFVAADICRVLEIQNITQAISRLDDDEHLMLNIGRQGDAHLVNEPGLYSLILASRKQQAKPFKRWVTHDVLPTLRENGFYAICSEPTAPQKLFTAEDYLSAARILANCKSDRLPYILGLLSAGGWELSQTPKHTLSCNTADISEHMQRAMSDIGLTLKQLSDSTGISVETLRSYLTGRRFPKQDRYKAILGAISMAGGGE